MTVEEIFVVDVIKSVVESIQVQNPEEANGIFFEVNFEPGSNNQIIEALANKDKDSLHSLKYPLVAMVMPIPEKEGSGFLEVSFPRIVIAYLTKTNGEEDVISKYSSDGVFKKILNPIKIEFIKHLAFSTYTNMGDPDAYEYTSRQIPSRQKIGQGLNDFVEIIEILNLKATIFKNIKTC